VSVLLLSRLEVPVRSLVDLPYFWGLNYRLPLRVKDFFGIFKASRWDSELNLAVLCLLGPLVAPLEALAQGLSLMGSILALLHFVELVGKPLEILCLNHRVHVLDSFIGRAPVSIALREMGRIVSQARLLLNLARLVDM